MLFLGDHFVCLELMLLLVVVVLRHSPRSISISVAEQRRCGASYRQEQYPFNSQNKVKTHRETHFLLFLKSASSIRMEDVWYSPKLTKRISRRKKKASLQPRAILSEPGHKHPYPSIRNTHTYTRETHVVSLLRTRDTCIIGFTR